MSSQDGRQENRSLKEFLLKIHPGHEVAKMRGISLHKFF
jgi:hypothetical protein